MTERLRTSFAKMNGDTAYLFQFDLVMVIFSKNEAFMKHLVHLKIIIYLAVRICDKEVHISYAVGEGFTVKPQSFHITRA